jgi:hypothetical protein
MERVLIFVIRTSLDVNRSVPTKTVPVLYGIRWQGVAYAGSPWKLSTGSSDCYLSNACLSEPDVSLTVKPVGEPDAGNRHVRFLSFHPRGSECKAETAAASDPSKSA